MPATVRFERSGACAEKHGGEDGAHNDVILDTSEGPWVQFTYDSLRTQDGLAVAAIAECGCWQVEGDDGFYSDVIVSLDS